MIDGLKLINLPVSEEERSFAQDSDIFVLNTCQRTLLLSFKLIPTKQIKDISLDMKIYEGSEAYSFLLETILGLQSHILCETEIVYQFKNAYRKYLAQPIKNPRLIWILEKLFKDAKEIRTRYLSKIGGQSYAGIARHILNKKNSDKKVLILGSGSLTTDLIKLLRSKHEIYLSARNEEKVSNLCNNFSLKQILWFSNEEYLKFNSIINTVGTNEILFPNSFFRRWIKGSEVKKLFIDLGSPSSINTNYGINEGIIRLDDIFKESANLNREKEDKVLNAKKRIDQLVERRSFFFAKRYHTSKEEVYRVQ